MRVFVACLATLCAFAPVFAKQTTTPKRTPPPAAKPTGTLAQIMRGIYFPNSNRIFDVQEHDPAQKNSTESTRSASGSYADVYIGWEAVENAAVAITDGVDLVLNARRRCQNGKPVPVQQPDFQKFARNMRSVGLAVLEAARAKNQEKVADLTNDLAEACSNCHEAYRDAGPADSSARCTPAAQK
jgi:hypothetical protein